VNQYYKFVSTTARLVTHKIILEHYMRRQYKMKKGQQDICFFFATITIYIIYYSIEHYDSWEQVRKHRTIEKDGFVLLSYDNYTKTELDEVFKMDVLKYLPQGYRFADYSYGIKNATISTFHRDVTSSQKLYNSKHAVYTLVLYKHEGCLLSLCPGSNYSYPFVSSQIVNISGPAGSCILFNCDLLHAGCFNHCRPREIVQYKLFHEEDALLFEHLHDVHVLKEEEHCDDSMYVHFIRKCSYFFELPINTVFYPLFQKKHNDGVLKDIQDYSSMQFYYNS